MAGTVLTITEQKPLGSVLIDSQNVITALNKNGTTNNISISSNIGSTKNNSGFIEYTYNDFIGGNGTDSDGSTRQQFDLSTNNTMVITEVGRYEFFGTVIEYNEFGQAIPSLSLYVFSD